MRAQYQEKTYMHSTNVFMNQTEQQMILETRYRKVSFSKLFDVSYKIVCSLLV